MPSGLLFLSYLKGVRGGRGGIDKARTLSLRANFSLARVHYSQRVATGETFNTTPSPPTAGYRSTSLMTKRHPPGPCSAPMPTVLQGHLAHEKTPPPLNRPRTIGRGLL